MRPVHLVVQVVGGLEEESVIGGACDQGFAANLKRGRIASFLKN
jgi:hypothetical protein